MKKSTLLASAALVGAATMAGTSSANAASASLEGFQHVVVIYEENHSFDNLYGNWGTVGGTPVNGRQNATPAETMQVRQNNVTAYNCLLQDDVNLTSPPLSPTCNDATGSPAFSSAFTNAPFSIDQYIPSTATTCPPPGAFAPNGVANGTGQPGGCTRDLVHRYYNEQYQIHGGKQNRYVTGSDAAGLSMGYYDSTQLPIYAYLHGAGAPNYVIADNFFQGAFGGSFLNHQWLVAGATPVFANAPNDGSSNDLHSVVDANGMPANTPLYASPLGNSVKDLALTASCHPPAGRPATPANIVCGDYAVNTIQPTYQPYSPGSPASKRLPPLTNITIGDELTAAGISWAWYSGGWSNANGDVGGPGWTNGSGPNCSDPNVNSSAAYPNCPDKLFQFHHQAFNYFASFAPGSTQRAAHLKDEQEFVGRANAGTLPAVSFVKPIGEENEHPGYTGEPGGSGHLVALLHAIFDNPQNANTLVIVTYDEFGGQWDHVAPPGNSSPTTGRHDIWGPGTRIPALVLATSFSHSGVDHVVHDTTSILHTIEEKYNLSSLGPRDASVLSLRSAIQIGNGQP
jgi:acid phosphatase